MIKQLFLSAMIILFTAVPVAAQDAARSPFSAGTAIPDYGKIADVESDIAIPDGTKFRIAFDAGKANIGETNRTINSAARFINMHVAAGVPADDIHLAIVIHGQAVFDVTKDAVYAKRFQTMANATSVNPSSGLVSALLKNNVEIIVCGQSAAAHGVAKGDLLPGVKMALSAMTVHALLQQKSYTLNPF